MTNELSQFVADIIKNYKLFPFTLTNGINEIFLDIVFTENNEENNIMEDSMEDEKLKTSKDGYDSPCYDKCDTYTKYSEEKKRFETIFPLYTLHRLRSNIIMELHLFNKSEYNACVQNKRKNFIHTHFSSVLMDVFNTLRKEAEGMKVCHLQIQFDVPQHFDTDVIEHLLEDYFKDLGYTVITEARKEDTKKVTLTLA